MRQVVCVRPRGRMVPDPSANFRVPPSLPSGCICVKTLRAPSSTLSACGFQSRLPFLSLPPDADTALWVWGPRGHGAGRAVSVGCPVSSGRPRAPQTGGQEAACGTEGRSCMPIQLLTFGPKGRLGLGASGSAEKTGLGRGGQACGHQMCPAGGQAWACPGTCSRPRVSCTRGVGLLGAVDPCTHEPTCFFTGLSLQCLRRTKHPSELQALLR